MATKKTRRNRLLIAAIVALLAAGSLCVWGASALGLQVRSPALEAAITAFTEANADEDGVDVAVGGNGDVNVDTGTGNGDASGDGDGSGDGDTGGGDSDGDGNGNGSGGDVNASNETCFLGLICFSTVSNVSANTGALDGTNLNLDVDADANEDGVNANANANADSGITTADCQLLDVNADGVLNADDDISTDDEAHVAALCDDIGFNVDLNAILGDD